MPSLSARKAAWLLAGVEPIVADATPHPISAGEAERIDLVDAIAVEIQHCRPADLRVYRRLLQHLQGPIAHRLATSRLQ